MNPRDATTGPAASRPSVNDGDKLDEERSRPGPCHPRVSADREGMGDAPRSAITTAAASLPVYRRPTSLRRRSTDTVLHTSMQLAARSPLPSFMSTRNDKCDVDSDLIDATCGLSCLMCKALRLAGVKDEEERSKKADIIVKELAGLYIRTPEDLRDALDHPEVTGQVVGILKGMLLVAVRAQLAERAEIREKWTSFMKDAGSRETTPAGSQGELNKPRLCTLQVARADITHLAEIDQISQTFYARVFLVLRIKDGASDPYLSSLYTGFPVDNDGRFTFRPSARWYLGQIDFPNGKSIKNIESKVTKQGNDLQLIKRVEGHFSEEFELRSFPFDEQDLTITVSSNCACEGPVPVKFVEANSPQLGVDTINFPHGNIWHLSPNLTAAFTTVGASRQRRFPAVHIRAGVRRKCGFIIMNAAMPVSVISFLSLTTFFVPPEDTSDRLELSLAVLLTSVAFKFTTSSYLPQISYMTLMDIFTILSTLIIVVVCLFHTGLGILDRWIKVSHDVLNILNKVCIVVTFMAWIGVQMWFVYKERRIRKRRLSYPDYGTSSRRLLDIKPDRQVLE